MFNKEKFEIKSVLIGPLFNEKNLIGPPGNIKMTLNMLQFDSPSSTETVFLSLFGISPQLPSVSSVKN